MQRQHLVRVRARVKAKARVRVRVRVSTGSVACRGGTSSRGRCGISEASSAASART